MKIKNKHLLVLVLSLFVSTFGFAQEKYNSIEIDPTYFVQNGYSFHIRIKPSNVKHFVFGAGIYALDIPNAVVDLNSENSGKGWKVRLNTSYSLFGEYYLKEANTKWFVGLQTGIQNYVNSNEHIAEETCTYWNQLAMPYVGYSWFPFKFPLYIKPWAGLGYTSQISGSTTIKGVKYDISPIVPLVAVHVGYTFK